MFHVEQFGIDISRLIGVVTLVSPQSPSTSLYCLLSGLTDRYLPRAAHLPRAPDACVLLSRPLPDTMPPTHPPTHIEFIARALIVCRRHVLLCRSVKKDYFYLPGGHVEPGEAAAVAAGRELMEEAGIKGRCKNLLHIAEFTFKTRNRAHHEVNMTFMFHVEHPRLPTSGRASIPEIPSREREISFEWVPFSTLGSIDLRPEPTREFLLVWCKARKPSATTQFSPLKNPRVR